ncbi:MAG: hypothetical protein IKW37_01395 [Bacteroidaceae bacterium]|nr:hypothetical protein [Bacteroidaceae bacterium]
MARMIIYALALFGAYAWIWIWGECSEILTSGGTVINATYMILAIIAMNILMFLDMMEDT